MNGGAGAGDLRARTRLANVRLQRVIGEVVIDPPFSVAKVAVTSAQPEFAVHDGGFACRLTHRVALLDADGFDLGAVETVTILEYDVDGGPPDPGEVEAFVGDDAAPTALPYVRETVHSVTARLGIAVVLGLLYDDDALPTEVRVLGGASRDAG